MTNEAQAQAHPPQEDELENSFECPITHEIMKDPYIVAESGHSYEKKAIEDWLKINRLDPLTKVEVKQPPIPNRNLQQAIEAYNKKPKQTNPPSQPKATVDMTQDNFMAALGYGNIAQAKTWQSRGASFFSPGIIALYPLPVALLSCSLETVKYVEENLTASEATRQWKMVDFELTVRTIDKMMPTIVDLQHYTEVDQWYESQANKTWCWRYDSLCLAHEEKSVKGAKFKEPNWTKRKLVPHVGFKWIENGKTQSIYYPEPFLLFPGVKNHNFILTIIQKDMLELRNKVKEVAASFGIKLNLPTMVTPSISTTSPAIIASSYGTASSSFNTHQFRLLSPPPTNRTASRSNSATNAFHHQKSQEEREDESTGCRLM